MELTSSPSFSWMMFAQNSGLAVIRGQQGDLGPPLTSAKARVGACHPQRIKHAASNTGRVVQKAHTDIDVGTRGGY